MSILVLPTREILPLTSRARLIRIGLNGQSFPFTAGQSVVVGLHGSATHKPYSLASSPQEARASDALELLVGRDDLDPETPHLDRLRPGMPLDVAGPFGTFVLPDPPVDDHLLFVAGGTGIAPLRSMLVDAVDRELPVKLTLVYSARRLDELAYRELFDALSATGRLRFFPTVTRGAAPADLGRQGRVGHALLREALGDVNARAFICGPPAFVSASANLLQALGVAAERVISESY